MKWGTMQQKLANKGEIVDTKRWGIVRILSIEFENDLNWFTYTISTEFGQKRIQNDDFVFKGGRVVKHKIIPNNKIY